MTFKIGWIILSVSASNCQTGLNLKLETSKSIMKFRERERDRIIYIKNIKKNGQAIQNEIFVTEAVHVEC